MKNIRTSFLLLALLAVSNVYASNYIFSKSLGALPHISDFRNNASKKIAEPAAGSLSEWQQLPFEWEFYGNKVNGYYISESGYITFNAEANKSYSVNTAIPAPEEPNNAIYGFWHSFTRNNSTAEWAAVIRTQTSGDAPNRIHVVYFISLLSRANISNNASFAISLYESGGFSITYVSGRSATKFYGTAGAENDDGSVAVQIPNSPQFEYPDVTAVATDDITYNFFYSDYSVDAELVEHYLPNIAIQNTSKPIIVKLKNSGNENIASFDAFFVNNNSEPVKNSFSGLDIAPNSEYTFEFDSELEIGAAGIYYDITIWIENVNGEQDGNPANDTLRHKIFSILGNSATMNVLVEQFTGAWCGWCPDGTLQMKEIEKRFPRATLVAIHAGSQADNMKIQEGLQLSNLFTPSYPQAMINRTKFQQDKPAIPISRGTDAWLKKVEELEKNYTPIEITVTPQYDKESRRLTAFVKIYFADYLPHDIVSLNVWLVENDVTGTGTGWDQANYYSNNSSYPNHPLYKEPNPIKNYMHRYVFRQSLTGYLGVQILQFPNAGDIIEMSYNTELPQNFKENDVSIIAFAGYNNSQTRGYEILNSASAKLLKPDAVAEGNVGINSISISPNPAKEFAEINISGFGNKLTSIEVINLLGNKLIEIGQAELVAGSVFINVSELESGAYIIAFKLQDSVRREMLRVVK